MVGHPRVKSTASGSRSFTILCYGLSTLLLLPVAGSPLNTPAAAQEENKQESRIIKIDDHLPKIKNAKLISISGADSSLRAYFFESKQAAESFAQAMATFKIATRFQLVVSATEVAVLDMDRKIIVMLPGWADQQKIQSSKVILLEGTRAQHARVEQVMQALDAD
ncbi:MAG: hypothetical protein KDA77_16845 [Planctomycetaceae bacterium]|nr:hypothetical protein [Planctomycetaceae bacterium]